MPPQCIWCCAVGVLAGNGCIVIAFVCGEFVCGGGIGIGIGMLSEGGIALPISLREGRFGHGTDGGVCGFAGRKGHGARPDAIALVARFNSFEAGSVDALFEFAMEMVVEQLDGSAVFLLL